MGDWKADRSESVAHSACAGGWCSAHLWIVPARVAGSYRIPQGELELTQKYQMLTGSFRAGGRTLAITDGRVRGEEISFKAGGKDYRGRVSNGKLELK